MNVQRRNDMNNETVSRLMKAAEELFAEFGHENVSLRQLTSRAGVNVAAVNYYFGSKEALTDAVFERLTQEACAYRRQKIAELGEEIEDRRSHLEALVRIFVHPYLGEGNEVSGRLLARFFLRHRLHPTEGTQRITDTYNNPFAHEYIAELKKVCPSLCPKDIFWHYQFMVNTIMISSAEDTSFERIEVLSGGEISTASRAERMEALVRFLVSALSDG
ncbi:TetR/AcrR family transcriptional regulator [Amorphus sp. 3PC139-8]|uniref:TetR/AcrR family transcriptional regulator n=1 Tax=Amorphus sp. 3PC139-8 TaxID=2735676 RepID=UPI00345DF811